MLRTRAKICGIRSLDVALHAVRAGADALGFVFYEPSPRAISEEAAAQIIVQLPPLITTVGLFVNADSAAVARIVATSGIDLLQFHGDETEAFCNSFGRPYIKAVRVQAAADIEAAITAYPSAKALLLDTYVAGTPGGTGKAFDWQLIPPASTMPFILAGGLDASNVAAAIAQIRPYAVDVSGGVEQHKGTKDLRKIDQFMNAVQTA